VRRGGSGPITQVHLLGVAAASGRWAEKSKEFLSSSLTGRTVTLKLEPTQTRDLRGRLLASVFLEPRQSISADVVGLGLARADRHIPYSFHGAVERAESEARKKHRGLWSALHPV
jgi:endonuclease YncB( thermonuclease family)